MFSDWRTVVATLLQEGKQAPSIHPGVVMHSLAPLARSVGELIPEEPTVCQSREETENMRNIYMIYSSLICNPELETDFYLQRKKKKNGASELVDFETVCILM